MEPFCAHYLGGQDLIDELKSDKKLMENKSAKDGVENVELLLHYCNLYGCTEKVNCCIY